MCSTLELKQLWIELCGSIYMWMFVNKYVLPYYMIHGWLNLQMWILGVDCKVMHRFLTVWKVGVPSPRAVQGSTVISSDPLCNLIPLTPAYISNKFLKRQPKQMKKLRQKEKGNLPNTMQLAELGCESEQSVSRIHVHHVNLTHLFLNNISESGMYFIF